MPKRLSKEQKARLENLEQIKKAKINPYPEKYERTATLAEAKKMKEGEKVKAAGRIMLKRDMGKITFCHLLDAASRMQIVLKKDELEKEKYDFFLKNFDIGDFLGVEGKIFVTKKGEISILVEKYKMLSKSLRPLPEKWHGLKDIETKYRKRYLDLIMNREVKERFDFRGKLIRSIREFYWKENFQEVETSVLSNTASGALATPFKTHHEALDIDLYLRIAPEIQLKELIAGGYEKIFEIGKVFRNEGIDPSHLPEFTMIEHYAAYWNFEDNMKFTEKMLTEIIKKMKGTLKLKILNRDEKLVEVNLKTPWKVVSFRDLLIKDCGIDINKYADVESLRKEIKIKRIKIEDIEKLGRGNLIDALYKEVSRPKIVQPTFLINHPIDVSPLARRNDKNPLVADRFQLIINGWEMVNAYSELIDPLEQKKRFDQQMRAKAGGDIEAMEKDIEFIQAMEYGMPPISGWGMGVERLAALLTEQTNLRELVFFPLMKPKD